MFTEQVDGNLGTIYADLAPKFLTLDGLNGLKPEAAHIQWMWDQKSQQKRVWKFWKVFISKQLTFYNIKLKISV